MHTVKVVTSLFLTPPDIMKLTIGEVPRTKKGLFYDY